MKKELENWLKMVKYDLATAKQMYKTKRYLYVIFMSHLAMEKLFKAVICKKEKTP